MRYGKWKVRYHLKCCVIVNALIECKITFFKVVRQSLKVFYETSMLMLIATQRIFSLFFCNIDN